MTYPRITFPRVPDARIDHYFNRYIRLCSVLSSLERTKAKGDYLEKHRILPGCLGGDYLEKNVVLVSRREHALLHLLLHKSFPEHKKLAQCAAIMYGSRGVKFYKSLAYTQSCEEKSILIAKSNKQRKVTWGDKISHSLKGYEKTKEHRDNISKAMREVWSSDPSMLEKCSRKGSKHSEESKRKTSEAISSQKWYWKIENGVVMRTRSKEHPGDGWNRGKNPR